MILKKESPEIISSVSIAWVNIKPEIKYLLTGDELGIMLNNFKEQGPILSVGPAKTEMDTFRILRKVFTSKQNTLLFHLTNIVRTNDIIEYKLEGSGKEHNWISNDQTGNIIRLNDLPPGQYKLSIRYSIQRHNVTEFEFEIKANWYQTLLFKIAIGILVAAFAGFAIMIFKFRNDSRKLKTELRERKHTESELKAIRNQLNPHFVFNSLSSIQSLINNNKIDAANEYLSEFSKLMRSVLSESENEFTSLSLEVSTIGSYLKLEQLRFGFEYSIEINDGINPTETEIPAMLIQPLIENAVKHGVSHLHGKGKLKISVEKTGKDLLMKIYDNGPGIPKSGMREGYGIKLTKTRIELINKVLKDQSLALFIESGVPSGTIMILKYINWL